MTKHFSTPLRGLSAFQLSLARVLADQLPAGRLADLLYSSSSSGSRRAADLVITAKRTTPIMTMGTSKSRATMAILMGYPHVAYEAAEFNSPDGPNTTLQGRSVYPQVLSEWSGNQRLLILPASMPGPDSILCEPRY